MAYFKNKNTFLVDYTICFHVAVHDKWCLHISIQQNENGLERGF